MFDLVAVRAQSLKVARIVILPIPVDVIHFENARIFYLSTPFTVILAIPEIFPLTGLSVYAAPISLSTRSVDSCSNFNRATDRTDGYSSVLINQRKKMRGLGAAPNPLGCRSHRWGRAPRLYRILAH
jgi:hypothetical protein